MTDAKQVLRVYGKPEDMTEACVCKAASAVVFKHCNDEDVINAIDRLVKAFTECDALSDARVSIVEAELDVCTAYRAWLKKEAKNNA